MAKWMLTIRAMIMVSTGNVTRRRNIRSTKSTVMTKIGTRNASASTRSERMASTTRRRLTTPMTTPLVRKEPEGLRMEAETATLTRIARSAPIVGARRLLPREKLTDVGAETVIDATTTTAAIGASIATMTAVARRPADLYHDVLHLAVRRHGARHRAAMIEATTPAISGVMTVGTGTASTIGAVVGLTTAEAATTIGATTEGGATIGGGVRASAPRPRGARSRLRKTTASPSASGTASSGWTRTSRRW
mmetsp:Transcript_34656/g.76204  ORF Transcript_34656/g.76204 Transcript_34656/m.76204 type:complete len:249 (+) Transcript_34656:106-852(+)